MKQLGVRMVVFVFATSLLATAVTAQQADKVKVLNQYLGTWNSHVDIKPSKWLPRGEERIETQEVQ